MSTCIRAGVGQDVRQILQSFLRHRICLLDFFPFFFNIFDVMFITYFILAVSCQLQAVYKSSKSLGKNVRDSRITMSASFIRKILNLFFFLHLEQSVYAIGFVSGIFSLKMAGQLKWKMYTLSKLKTFEEAIIMYWSLSNFTVYNIL